MANRVTMTICGQDYTLVADESAAYMQKVGALVDQKMTELMESAHVSRYDAAVLAAINLADELYKQQEGGENLRRQLKEYLEDYATEETKEKGLKVIKDRLAKIPNETVRAKVEEHLHDLEGGMRDFRF